MFVFASAAKAAASSLVRFRPTRRSAIVRPSFQIVSSSQSLPNSWAIDVNSRRGKTGEPSWCTLRA